MKKLFILTIVAMVAITAKAGFGFYDVHMDYCVDGDHRDYGFHDSDDGTPVFELGTLTSSIVIEALYLKFYDDTENSRCLNDAEFGYKIDGGNAQNYGYGSWVITDKVGSNYELQKTAFNFTLAEAANFAPGIHTIEFWFKAWGNGDRYVSNSGANYKFRFYIPYTVNITPDGYASFFSATEAVELPSEATAYAGTLNGNSVTLTDLNLGGKVPANTAVILKVTPGTTQIAISKVDEEISYTGANDLRGTDVAIATSSVSGTVMVLGYENGAAGFFTYTGATLGAHKAYLAVESSEAPAVINIVETTTAIDNVDASAAVKVFENGQLFIKKNGVVYNAMGQIIK